MEGGIRIFPPSTLFLEVLRRVTVRLRSLPLSKVEARLAMNRMVQGLSNHQSVVVQQITIVGF